MGRTGGADGIVGIVCDADDDADAEADAEAETEEAVTRALLLGAEAESVVPVSACCGAGSGFAWRLCRWRSSELNEESPALVDQSAERASSKAGCEMYRVVAVMNMRTAGMRRIVHFVRRAMLRFSSSEAVYLRGACDDGEGFCASVDVESDGEDFIRGLEGTYRNCLLSSSASLGGDSHRKVRGGAGEGGGVNISECTMWGLLG